MRNRLVDWGIVALLALLVQTPGLLGWIDSDPLLLLSPLGHGGTAGLLPGLPGWIDPNYGTTTQTLGGLAAADWLSGHVPWWNPYSGVGVPLAAEMQPAALFLPFVLLLHLPHGLLWLRAAIGAVAGLGAYELLRALGLGRAACLAGGVLFALNGTAAWLPHGPDRAAAFLPWLLLGIERSRLRAVQARPLGWLGTAVALAFSLYAGFPETAYLDGLLAVAWGLWRLAAPGGAAGHWAARRRLAAKLGAGVAAGLLLAAPALLPFAHFLRHAELGSHAAGFAHGALPASAWPMFLLPYVYGPIYGFGADYPLGVTRAAWSLIGGYAGAAAVLLALARLLGRAARDGGLRWLLAGWIAICLAKTANLPWITTAANLAPGMGRVAFFRYAEPSWTLALIVLAAGAIDALTRVPLGRWRLGVWAAGGLALLAGALWQAWPTLAALAPVLGALAFAMGSAQWFLTLLLLLALLLAGPARRWRAGAAAALAGLEAIVLFTLPLLSAGAGARLDRAPLDFLHANLGLQRFYSLGTIPPEYGARFGIAQINDDMLPVPRAWAEHVRDALDPLADPVTFTGSFGARAPGPDPRAMLLAHLDAYRALGVRYVVTRRGPESLSAEQSTARLDQPGHPWPLPPGVSVSGTLPASFAEGAPIDAIAVDIGTYAGRADGVLAARLCSASTCAAGQAALRGVADNAPLDIALAPPLPAAPGQALRFTLWHRGGAGPLALWLLPGSAASLDAPGAPAGRGPALIVSRPWPGSPLVRVFRDASVDIFELPGAAPYFSADPPCELAPRGRLELAPDCPQPSVLTRRELAFPGWRASIDGRHAALGSEGILQTLALPAGRSSVRFRYLLPHIGAAYAAMLLGLVWLTAAVCRASLPERTRRRMRGGLSAGGRAAAAVIAAAGRAVDRALPAGAWRDRLLIVLLPTLLWLPALLGAIDVSPALRLTVLRVGGHPGWLPGLPGWLDVNFGFTTEALGRLAANDWFAGQLPWWNPYAGVGVPLAAEMQPAALFLPFVLLLHWNFGLVLLRLSMQAVAGIGAYELLRALGLRRTACLAGGVLFAFNGTGAWMAHGPDRVAAFLPLILLGIERSRLRAAQGRPLGWLWLAVALAYSLYAGFPETAYLDGLFAGLWAAWRLLGAAGAPPGQSWRVRARLLAKLASGAAAGLLLAAPAVWPFLDFLRRADIGDHAALFAHAALPRNGYPMFLIPYLYGNMASFGGTGPADATWITWGEVGGYIGGAAATLALVGLLAGRGVLRWVLAGWIAACLAKTAALPWVTAAFNALPMIPQTAVFRYAEPSWSLAATVLAALAIDAWRAGRLARWQAPVAAGLAAALLGAMLWLAWPTVLRLLPLHGYLKFGATALAWCVATMAAVLLLLGRAPTSGRSAALLCVVFLDAMLLWGQPLLASGRGARLDTAPIDFLREHLGLQRFYALGALVPNYGSYFGVASIDETMIPAPADWAAYVRDQLDPGAEPVAFDGLPRDGRPPADQPAAALRARLGAYRALGVRYVVSAAGEDPLAESVATAEGIEGRTPLVLAPGASLAGALPAGLVPAGRQVGRMAVAIGTYGGQADGSLAVTLCTPRACASGAARLGDAADNADFTIDLTPALRIEAGDMLTFGARSVGATHPVAIWLSRASTARLTPPAPGGGPVIRLILTGKAIVPRPVFADARIEIAELPDPAPYFSADPACRLEVRGRRALAADCAAPALLTRRELSFPGWRARIDGHRAALGRIGLFQTLALPTGRSEIRFTYAPPGIAFAYAAAALGALWMLAAWLLARLPHWRRPRRAL